MRAQMFAVEKEPCNMSTQFDIHTETIRNGLDSVESIVTLKLQSFHGVIYAFHRRKKKRNCGRKSIKAQENSC